MKLLPSILRRSGAALLSAMLISGQAPLALAGVVQVAPVSQTAPLSGTVGVALQPAALAPGISASLGSQSLSFRNGLAALPSVITPQVAPGVAPAAQSAPAANAVSQDSSLPLNGAVVGAPAVAGAPAVSQAAPAPGLQIVREGSPLLQTSPVQAATASPSRAEASRPTVQASAPKTRGIVAALKKLFLGNAGKAFDNGGTAEDNGTTATAAGGGLGILPQRGLKRAGVRLDARPEQPGQTEVPRISWNRVNLPGARQPLLTRIFRPSSVQPVALPGNPQDAIAVKAALLDMIAANPAEFGGLAAQDLQTKVAHKVDGQEGLATTVYVTFQQQLNGVAVEGTYLSFTVKMIAGQAVVVASSAQLYPKLNVDSFGRLGDNEIVEKAFERLGRPTGSIADIQRIGRRIMHLDGRWRSVYLVTSESTSFVSAVDVNSGEAFAWDGRMSAVEPNGSVAGRGIEFDPGKTGENLVAMAMANLEIKTSDGRTLYTDKDGFFTLENAGDSDAPVTITAKLTGKYVTVNDNDSKDLAVTATVKPGEKVRVLFNPQGADETATAQVNAYRHVNVVHDFLAARGVKVDELDKAIPVKTNLDDECNAYYTPWYPSLNFFKSSERCVNTSYETVIYHEYGHHVDSKIGGIVNGGLSEGWGDIMSLYITRQPILGESFFKTGDRKFIRTGENTYQYKDSDEVHAQGQAWGGFAWKLRVALVESFKAAGLKPEEADAKGGALSESLVLPVLFAGVRDIPAAIEAVLLRDVGSDGTAEHFKEIQAAAKAHDITVKEPKPGQAESTLVRLSFNEWIQRLARRLAHAVLG